MQKVCQRLRQFQTEWCSLLVCLVLCFNGKGICQDSTYHVPRGLHPTEVIPIADRYQYSGFQRGILYFATGEKSEEFLLNYNHFAQEFQLLNSNGDTVALDNKMSIVEFVQIQSDFYFRDMKQGYFLVVTKEEPLNLLMRIKWNSLYFPSGEASFQKGYEFYFLGPKNLVHKAEKTSLLKIFPNDRKQITKYLSERHVDFQRESDLKSLVTFCNGFATQH